MLQLLGLNKKTLDFRIIIQHRSIQKHDGRHAVNRKFHLKQGENFRISFINIPFYCEKKMKLIKKPFFDKSCQSCGVMSHKATSTEVHSSIDILGVKK